jgi:malate dehydrogenase (oxaloacetate-decarboxylating)(NADP+)
MSLIRKRDALEYHSMGRKGKVEVVATKPMLTQRDLSLAYTPGVAEPCLAIEKTPELAFEYTAKGNLVAVVSDGTAVLGLGNIGPLAGKPVMEGKGVLFKRFADIDVFDIELDCKDPDKIVEIVAALEPTFGGINLEDIKAPECFYIETELKKRMKIPVFHDDQHGTAIISGAGLLNALELQKKDISKIRVVVSGAGAAAISCAEHYIKLGAKRENFIMVDTKGVVYQGRGAGMNPYKERFAQDTKLRTLADAMKGADVLLGCSVAGMVTKEMIASMNDRPIVFAMANPDPEITYPDAVSVRTDIIMATGRSDYPNQVNNVLGFPFIFRGALDVRATAINDDMKVAASHALANLAKLDVPEAVSKAYGGARFKFGPEYIIPKPFDTRVLWHEAGAVAKSAMDTGVAQKPVDMEEYVERLKRRIGATHEVLVRVRTRAKAQPKRIVFPEATTPAVLRAVQTIVDENIAKPILLGVPADIKKTAAELELGDVLGKCEIIHPQDSPLYASYVEKYWALRSRKGINKALAQRHMWRRHQFGMMMVREGDADGYVAGYTMEYPETMRPALQIIGIRPEYKRVVGMYMMIFKGGGVKFFADATVNIAPNDQTLAEVAMQVADAVKELGITPHVAMLSYSNFGSARYDQSERVARAVAMVRERRPDLEIDGELQADVAVDYEMLKEEFPFCRLTEAANVLIFPNLSAGNIAYKLMQKLGGAEAVGPILLGIRKPVTVLARGCSAETIVNMTAVTVMKAQGAFDAAAVEKMAARVAPDGAVNPHATL